MFVYIRLCLELLRKRVSLIAGVTRLKRAVVISALIMVVCASSRPQTSALNCPFRARAPPEGRVMTLTDVSAHED